MANTVTQRTLIGGGSDRTIIRLIHIVSDGTEESDLVVYDNSAFIADVTRGRLMKIIAMGSDSICRLEWDQTTDSPVVSINPSSGTAICLKEFGGISNPAGSGATGDLILTTAGLDSGDEVTLILEVNQH